jgi:hypothetical protein
MTLEPGVLPVVPGLSYAAADADVYLAADRGLVTRLQTNVTLAANSNRQGFLVATVDFSRFGQPVTIRPPTQ